MPKLPGINHEHAVITFEKVSFWIAREGKYIAMTNGERIRIWITRCTESLQCEVRVDQTQSASR